MTYDERVRQYEAQRMTRSDAQGIVDLEDLQQQKGKKVAHTPGPWKAMTKAKQPKDGLFYCMVHEDKEDRSVAPAKGFGLTPEQAIANAALIAAAPAMYEALKAIAVLPGFEPSEPYGIKVKEAIRLAEGRV